jgi:hypothetical protein
MALLVVVVVLLAAFVVTKFYNKKLGGPAATNSQPPLKVQETAVDDNKLPQGFPSDIPLEDGAVVTQNYNATTSGSENTASFQATRVFESKKTLEQNFDLYTTFFKQHGWTIKTSFEDVSAKSITAQKGAYIVTVHIGQNTITGTVTVNITASPASPPPSKS